MMTNANILTTRNAGAVELTEAELGQASGGYSFGASNPTIKTTTRLGDGSVRNLGNLGDTATHEVGH